MVVSRRRATLATLAGSTTSITIVSLQAILLIPLYVRLIGPRLYGAWLGSGDILVWMQAFDLGLPNLMIQRIGAAHGRGDLKSVAEYFATGMMALAIVALAIGTVMVVLSFPLSGWMGLLGDEARELQWCFIIGVVATTVNIFNNSIVGFSRGIQRTAFLNVVNIVASLAGFGVSLGIVLLGGNLWAIALGLVTRSGVSLIGGIVFTFLTLREGLGQFFRVRGTILREFLTVSPATALGGLSYAIMSQSESALAAMLIRPEAATVLTLTRKAVDLARSVVDMIGAAAYGGFAHLVASDQRHRALQVYAEINSLRLSLAVVLASAYMAVNANLVSVWVAPSQYGGSLLTTLMAIQFIVAGGSYLINYLYRATGPVVKGAAMLVIESLVRVPLMALLTTRIGLPALPAASILTSGVTAIIVYRWTIRDLSTFARPVKTSGVVIWIGRAVVFGGGLLLGLLVYQPSWTYVLLMGLGITLIAGCVLVYVDPLLGDLRTTILSVGALRMIQRLRERSSVKRS